MPALRIDRKNEKQKVSRIMIQDIAPRTMHNEYIYCKPEPEDNVIIFFGSNKRADRTLVKKTEDGHLVVPTYQNLLDTGWKVDEEKLVYLFAIDEEKFFLLNNEGKEEIQIEGFTYETNRIYCNVHIHGYLALAGTTAYHLFTWYRDNTFCGRCGNRTEIFRKERAIRCPECGNLIFPKIMPAIIVAVRDGNNLLCSRYTGREYKGVALIAGFCEIGETLEQTVAREVFEETGIRVKNIHYFGNQPWGLDSDLLLGFYCDVDGSTEIHIDEHELQEALFLPREEVPVPENTTSLTATLIDAFCKGII